MMPNPKWLGRFLLTLCLALSVFAADLVWASELPTFESDPAADLWLRENSPYYRMMASNVNARSSYSFRTSDKITGGMAFWESGKAVIELSHSLTGAKRLSILIFELTNLYQSRQHQEIDRGAAEGSHGALRLDAGVRAKCSGYAPGTASKSH